MDRKKIYDALFKTNSKGEHKFSQLTPIGKRILYMMINLAIGGSKVKSTIHDDKKSLKCEFCGITYSGKSNLNTHTALVHEKKNSNVYFATLVFLRKDAILLTCTLYIPAF